MPTSETTILDDSAVSEIEAQLKTWTTGGRYPASWNTVNALCATVKQLRAERDDLVVHVEERDSLLSAQGDFRARAIELCKDKAAKYKALADDSLPNDQTAARTAAIAAALTALANELEKL